MAGSVIQSKAQDLPAGGDPAVTPDSPFTAGSTILAWVTVSGITNTATVSDTTNGSYVQAGGYVDDVANDQRFGLFAFAGSAAGSPTVTCDWTGGIFNAILMQEIGGVALTLPAGTAWRTGQVQNAAGTNGLTSGNATPAQAASFLAGGSMASGTFPGVAASTGTPGFASPGTFWPFGTGGNYFRPESLVLASTTPVAATFTRNADANHIQFVAILSEPGGVQAANALFFGAFP